MQAYSDPERENDPVALPNVEVFHLSADNFMFAESDSWMFEAIDDEDLRKASKALAGWYWWSCFPGYLPDSDPFGPFKTEQEALEDAQDC